MDKKAIETLAVNAVRSSIVTSNFLDQFIQDNDKEPSWDGHVYIYTHKSKRKDCLKGRLPVQVKGVESNDFTKREISYPVATSDLTNYLNDGGSVFFVVYVGHEGASTQIYYAELTPIKLRLYIADAKTQKTKLLYNLITDPTSPDDILTAAYLLFGEQSLAKDHFEKLDKQVQQEFKTYPIYHFWQDNITE